MDSAEALYRKMWITKGTRFNAHARLNLLNQASVVTISVLSMYVILLSIYSILFTSRISDFGQAVINFINIGLSIAIAVFSVLEFAKGLSVQAERMLTCALELGNLYNLYQHYFLSGQTDPSKTASYIEQYNACVSEYKTNHHSLDHDLFRAQNASEFSLVGIWGNLEKVRIYAWYYLHSLGWYLVMIVTPLVLFLLLLQFGVLDGPRAS